MPVQAFKSGMVVLCDRRGVIAKVVHDGLGVEKWLQVGSDFATAIGIHAESALDPDGGDAARFMAALQHSGYAFGWEVRVVLDGRSTPLSFTGGATNDGMMIVGERRIGRSPPRRRADEDQQRDW